MRCGRCGNENKEENRFCGMCGAALIAPTPAAVPPLRQEPANPPGSVPAPRPGAAPVQPPPWQPAPLPSLPRQMPGATATAERNAGPPPRTYPEPQRIDPSAVSSIAGPSFLGLNTPGEARTEPYRDRSSGADLNRTSSSLDYLLDDDEPRRGWGKSILVLVALALAVGFGYLRYKQGGFEWLNPGEKKPAATAPDTTPGNANSGDSTVASSGNAAPPGASGTTAASGSAASQPTDSASSAAAPNAAANNSSPSNSPPSNPPSNGAAPNPGDSGPSQNASAPADSQTPPGQPPVAQTTPQGANAKPADQTADTDTGDESQPTPAPAPAKGRPTTTTPAKPVSAKPSAARTFDSVGEAERYIYGRGVPQDCDRGLRLLKPAAQSDPKAMISLGALYSTGTCAPRDLPTAYRWFAQALHKQPDNQTLQDDLQNLWSKMTPPERQLAIKLSQ